MNVTLKLDDELCRKARHRAVDADMSLSKWVAQVVEKEVGVQKREKKTMIDLLGMDDDRDLMDFIPNRKDAVERPIQFP